MNILAKFGQNQGEMPVAYFMTGGNLGDREENISRAREELETQAGKLLYRSAVYASEPWGFRHPKYFLNQLLVVETEETPGELLAIIHSIEESMHRTRKGTQNSARTIDIDILFYGNDIISENNLIIPHPRLHLRKFCLIPLMEMDPCLVHPVLNKTIWQLYRECADSCTVHPWKGQEA